ncbi:hypothetical protein [Halobaculum sp. P14]|uniref:hypothetical protein n=1 Tax=Halobaculum sp. P14 TaxID=3421638 RepID=UPI003EB9EB56
MKLSSRNRATLGTDGDGEFRCPHCRARCTESQSSSLPGEFGHHAGCPRRPERFPDGGGHYYSEIAADGGEEVDE